VPVKNTTCKQELLDYFAIQWSDTDKAVVLSSKLEQHPAEVADGEKLNAQRSIYQYLQKRV
jgi:polyphosphate kinase